MTQRPHSFGNRHSLTDNYSLERAAPRSIGQAEKHVHPVVRVPGDVAPYYARATQLYPMRSSTEKDNYRYRPTTGSLGTGSDARPASPLTPGQSVSIPIVHMNNQPRIISPNTNYGQTPLDPSSSPLSERSDSSTSHRTPLYQTSSAPIRSRTPASMNEEEAEVDHLTNLLMQSIKTKPSAAGSKLSSTSSNEGLNSSPSGTFRRSSASSVPLGYNNNQISRLQQHIGLSSSPTPNGGRGSPMNTGSMSSSLTTTAPSTNSPTESISNLQPTLDLSGAGMNTCFRCRRSLIPPEGSTLNPTLAAANSVNNMVTINGALGVRLHVACFTCYRCTAPLKPDAYHHIRRRLLCPKCVMDGGVEKCSTCQKPIWDRIVHAVGQPYHPNCFVCVFCGCRLDNKTFTIDVHGGLNCLDDFHSRYAPRCAYCKGPITHEAGTRENRRVVAGDVNYHVECYTQHVASPRSPVGHLGGAKFGTKILS